MLRGARGRIEDPVSEAAQLVGPCTWESTRAALFERRSVAVLVAPTRAARPDASDVSITVVARSGEDASFEDLAVTLTGPSEYRCARLDARGQAVIRDVTDACYVLDVCRVAELGQ